jgi:hypothetical protein
VKRALLLVPFLLLVCAWLLQGYSYFYSVDYSTINLSDWLGNLSTTWYSGGGYGGIQGGAALYQNGYGAEVKMTIRDMGWGM